MSVISEIITNKNGANPVLVDFENAKFNGQNVRDLHTKLYKNSKNETVIALDTDEMTYTGTANDKDFYKNYILAHNRTTNKCRLIHIDTATLHPYIEKNKDIFNTSNPTHNTSMSELNKAFGSKKTVRITEQRERLKMNIDAVKNDLEQTVANIDISDLGRPTNVEDNDGTYKPKINREASVKEQVYILDDIVPLKVLNSLKDESYSVFESSTEDLNELMPFVKFSVEQLSTKQLSEDTKIERCNILLYINYVLKFFSTPHKNMRSSTVICKTSPAVTEHILETFTTGGSHGRLRPLSMKTKSLCYILILGILALDYEINIDYLSKDIKLGLKKIQEIGRVLALSPGKNLSHMCLKLPLPAIVTNISKRKKK